MVQLSQILAEILETFYTLQASRTVAEAGPQGTQLILSLAKPIQLKLKEWYSGLPAIVRMDSGFHHHVTPTLPNRLSSIGYLHLAYFATEITLHRRIIRSIEESNAASGGSTSGQFSPGAASSPSPAPHGTTIPGGGVEPYIQDICRSAAKTRLISAMDFVNRLTPSHLRAFWYFASKTSFALIGTFGSLLWATSPGREEADWYSRRLAEYRWTLSVSSKPGEGKGLTEFAMGMLDISTGLLKQLPEKPLLSRSGSAVDFDAARRQSMLALGSGGGSATRLSGLAAMGGPSASASRGGASLSGATVAGRGSADASRVQSPGGGEVDIDADVDVDAEESESSEEGAVYGNFSATAGMAGLAD